MSSTLKEIATQSGIQKKTFDIGSRCVKYPTQPTEPDDPKVAPSTLTCIHPKVVVSKLPLRSVVLTLKFLTFVIFEGLQDPLLHFAWTHDVIGPLHK